MSNLFVKLEYVVIFVFIIFCNALHFGTYTMNFLNPSTLVKVFIILFIMTMIGVSYKVYQRAVFFEKQRKLLLRNFYDPNIDNITYTDILAMKFTERKNNMRSIKRMKANIKRINLHQQIYNTHYLAAVSDVTTIIVIQVHSNVFLFRQLLASLKTVYSIDTALLIFSHDCFDTEINKAVHTVNFAKYMQIFYPYSIQLHPNVFPGTNHNCKDGVCDSANMRDAVAAQQKNFWWWQMNQIFDHLEVIKNYNKTILFLEEDNFVTKDIVMIHKLLENVKKLHCPKCQMISLGAHDPDITQYKKKAIIKMESWTNKMSKLGIAFNRTIWRSIKARSEEFCIFDDYNWDNTLKHIWNKYTKTSFYIAAIDGPRVFNVEKCDETDISCKIEYKVDEVKKFVENIREAMFPLVVIMRRFGVENTSIKPLGYFQDERDHELCMHFTKSCVWF